MFNKPNFPDMPHIKGLHISTCEAGIKYHGRTDLLGIFFSLPTRVAGVFTTSLCSSAPVDHCKAALSSGKAKALIVNSGNANAFTGAIGSQICSDVVSCASDLLSCDSNEVFLASTGVIGEPFNSEKVTCQLSNLLQMSGYADKSGGLSLEDAAKAIMTTDLFPKGHSEVISTPEGDIYINGIAKGAGMIAPDMATMLSFIFTNAVLSAELCQHLLSKICATTFNAITVDSDTSTSDSLLLFSVGEEGVKISDASSPYYKAFEEALTKVMSNLALQIVQDGEGAKKLIKIEVMGAYNDLEAKKIAFSIANSPLVKTAVAGEDANWGRIVMAVGKAGQRADRDKLAIYFGDHCVAQNGARDPNYCEETLSAYMKNYEISITVDLKLNDGKFTVWTCDLTEEYIKINADYRS